MPEWLGWIIVGLVIWFAASMFATYCITVYFRHKREYNRVSREGPEIP